MRKIVFVYVESDFPTGQQRVTCDVLNLINYLSCDLKVVRFKTGFTLNNFILLIVSTCSIIFSSPKGSLIYLVGSRSVGGFFRDLPYLVFSLIGFRVVVHIHGADIFHLFSGRIGWLARFVYRRVETIYPTRVGSLALASYVSKSHVILGASYLTPSTAKRENVFTIVWNSNICFSKGIGLVLRSCQMLYSRGYKFKVLCFGEPISDFMGSAEECRILLKSFDNEPWFEWIGSCPEYVVQSALWSSSCNLLVSVYPSESQGLSVADAVASGIPIITSKLDCFDMYVGCPSVTMIDASVDFLIDALEDKMIKFYNSRELYFEEALQTLRILDGALSIDRFFKDVSSVIGSETHHGS